jgi:hypothetical protein
MQRQQNLLHVAMLYHRDLGVGPTDRITSPTSPAYTGTLWALLAALMNGAAFVFSALDSVAAFVETLDKEKITVAQLIVSLLRQVTQPFDERVRLPGLRLIYTGGETLRGQDVARCARSCRWLPCYLRLRFDGSGYHNAPACEFIESGGGVAGFFVSSGLSSRRHGGILLDEHGVVVVRARRGNRRALELFSPGYWRDPSLTRKHF